MEKYVSPCFPPCRRGGGNIPVISPLSGVPEITYDAVMKGHLCPCFPPFKEQGVSSPNMHPIPASLCGK